MSELRNQIKASRSLTENQKLDAVVDIDSLQDQLAKQTPNKTVVQSLWENINRVATIAGLVELASKVYSFIASLFS